ncbi:MAG: hypothetical protein ACRELC_03270, partial [Gemmatimonadota bacterium]
DIYLNYRGTCEQAFRFDERHLGGRITGMVRHGEQPNPGLPAGWEDKTPFANRFAMLRDKFGTNWMLLHQPEST